MSIGIILVLIVITGYASNRLNWKYLNHRITYLLYCIGTLVHESSHALICLLTGAKIKTFKVFTREPQLTHEKSRFPIIGELLISIAPIAGGLIFLFLVNHFLLADHFAFPFISSWQDIPNTLLQMSSQFNIFEWQTWVLVLLFINMGAMIGPSFQDMKNIWPALIILLFVSYPPLISIGLLALSLVLANIVIQVVLISGIVVFRKLLRVSA